MSELREAAQEALFWMQHARLHLTIKERLHPDGLIQYDNAARNLRAALAQPKTKLRDQHKAFAEWFLQQNPIAPNVEDMAWAAWKAALAQPEAHPPRDEWRLASEVPEDGRDVVVWMNDGGHGCFAIGHCLRGEWTPNYVGSPVTHWRDIDGPTEGE